MYAVKESGRLIKPLGFWFAELLVLAASYGLMITGYMFWEIRSDVQHAGLLNNLSGAPRMFAVVAIMAFMNLIRTGYIGTSLLARFLCMSKAPRLYALVLPCLVAIHLEVIRHMDHGWALTISYPIFVGWGMLTAFAIASLSVKLQNSSIRGAGNTR